MSAVARASRKKSWQTGRERVSVQAALAIQKENVMQRLVRLREEEGHPEKPGEPLPQDKAAAKAGVTARQWQRWESGESVPYARNLSAVADAFEFDVAEFYDGPAGQQPAETPDPFPAREDALTAIEQRVSEQLAEHARRVEDLLARQSKILERIEAAIDREDEAAKKRDEESERRLLEAAEKARDMFRDAAQTQGSERQAPTT